MALWLVAYLAYASVTVVAVLAGGSMPPGKAIVAGLLNALPEALLAPFVWRWAASPSSGGRRAAPGALSIGLFGFGFALWCAAASVFVYSAWRWLESSAFALSFDPAVSVWRFAMGALVFLALTAIGTAARRGREAAEAIGLAERAEAVRARAELATLRSQLNPHFLFNVLHSLIGIVHRDPDRAEAMIERLGDLLRDALRVHAEAKDELPLDEEIALTRRYLEIERLRLGERLRVTWRIEVDDQARHVPPFSLQSLVENAVRHSVAPRPEGGSIAIAVEEADGALVVTVDDDGTAAIVAEGMSDDESDEVPKAPPASATAGARLGLELLRERLRLLHGPAARLETERAPGVGFRARFRIPAERTEPA